MHLRTITLEGYRSIPPGSPLKMDNLGRFNILIGPNNSGKSTVLRFLQVVASLVGKRNELPLTIPWDQADRSWWWQGAVDNPIQSELVFAAPAPAHEIDSNAPGQFEHDGQWRVTITITGHPPKDCTVMVAPNVFLNGEWHPIVRNAIAGSSEIENLNRTGEYISSSSTDACPYRAGAATILGQWARGTRFYDPIRAVDRDAGRRCLVDGSELLKRIREQQLDQKQAFIFEKFRGRLIKELNALLIEPSSANPIESFEIKGEEREERKERLDLYIKRRADEAPIGLQYMGTGIAELTIFLADLLQNEDTKQYFMEEPECHLHPGLLGRLMVRLRELSSAQFFITTHSNAILDSTTERDSIYRFSMSPTTGTSVQRCSDVIERSGILDALGVSGSTLLQTNCVLWVEGPSDRIYLKLWLRHHRADHLPVLIEGSDFFFVYYGGKVLSHFAFAESGQDELVELIRICRYSAVVMDSDIDPSDQEEEVRQTKARIRDEALSDPNHRVAVFSMGREIENDVDPQIFCKAIAKLLGIKEERLSGLKLSGTSRYPEEVVKHLNLDAKAAKRVTRKLKDKVTLAEIVAGEWTKEAVVPSYVDELVKMVERSRLV
jgi:energy-coupling factor transporter ATP-binding protein EcfA2